MQATAPRSVPSPAAQLEAFARWAATQRAVERRFARAMRRSGRGAGGWSPSFPGA